jgi:predicted dehydrogenase
MRRNKNINRRKFLTRAIGTAVGVISFPYIVPSSALGAAETVAPSNRIVMGCIGVGGQGTNDMQAFLSNPDVQVVAVCDVDTNHRNAAGNIVNEKYDNRDCVTYNDFRELLARRDIDAVMVATPDHWHGLVTVTAAKAGKDIYCEKPLANTITEGRAMCEAVKRYGRVLQTGTQRRSFSGCRFACELVRNGRIGKLQTIRVAVPEGYAIMGGSFEGVQSPMPVPKGFDYDMWLGPAPWALYTNGRCHFNFRWILDYSGGYITDWGAHFLDIAQWGNGSDLTGPIEIKGRGEFPKDGLYNTATSHYVEFKYANGVKVISSATADSKAWGVRFEGTKGWLYVCDDIKAAHPDSLINEVIGPDEVHLAHSPGHHRNFLDAVKTRGQTTAPAEVGHRTATICHLANITILTGRKLKWDPQREQIINDPEANRMLSRPMRSPWHL